MNEQLLSLGQVFVDSTKVFDTVNRDALWKLLVKLGCTPVFVDKLRQLHPSMKAPVNYNGQLSGATEVENGVKQGDILPSTSFSSAWQRFFGIFSQLRYRSLHTLQNQWESIKYQKVSGSYLRE